MTQFVATEVGRNDVTRPTDQRRFTDRALVIVFLAASFNALSSYVPSDLRKALWLVLAASFAIRGASRVPEALRRTFPLVLLIPFSLLSVTWADSAAIALEQSAVLALAVGAGVGLVAVGGREALGRDLLTFLRLVVVASVAMVAIAPAESIAVGAGGVRVWQGLFAWPNALGIAAALGLVLGTHDLLRRRSLRPVDLTIMAFVLCIFRSGASSPRLVAAALVATVLFWAAPAGSPLLRLGLGAVFLAILVPLAAVIVGDVSAPLSALGKDRTLTGRTDLWSAQIEAIGERPALGHGYGVFWNSGDDFRRSFERSTSSFALEVSHGHNTWLNIAINFGLVGALLVVLVLVRLARTVRRSMRADGDFTWFSLLAIFCLAFSMTETVLFNEADVYLSLLVAGWLTASE